MFTGLIEDVGTVAAAEGARLSVQTRFDDLSQGASVAVDGVCLTVVALEKGRFTADVSEETRRRSTLGSVSNGQRVNLERPLAVGDRLGGHVVLGHVDGVGKIVERRDGSVFVVALPEPLMPLVVEKGSIALDGISLTVNEVIGKNRISLTLIPETLQKTTWGEKREGANVNVEADILAKHVARLMEGRFRG